MNKVISFTSLLTLCFVFTACQTSNAFRVPGEEQLIAKNISSEYFTIADGYADLKKYDKAVQYYKLAMKDKTLRLSAYYKLARCYALSSDWDNSYKCYSDLLVLDSENKDLKLSLAYVSAMKGETQKSLELYEKLTLEFPNDSSVLENYINLLIFTKNADKAREMLSLLEEKFPDNSNIKTLTEKVTALNEDADIPGGNAPAIPPA